MKKPCDVLIIEDEPQIRESLREAIEMEGHKVSVASNGRDALHVLKKIDPPSLILLDLFMPVMSGYEFLVEKVDSPEIRDTPVVVVSAAGNGIEGTGISGFLRKPVDLDKLYAVVDRHCRH